MSAPSHSKRASRRSARRDRVEAKHHPEAVFEPTEDQALASDLALNEVKPTPAYYASSDLFSLSQQNRGAL